MKKVKICFVINSMVGGGAERVSSLLIRELSKNDNFNISLCLLEKSDLYYELPTDIKISYLGQNNFNDNNIKKVIGLYSQSNMLREIIKKDNIDLIFSFLGRANYVSILASNKTNSKVIISERAMTSESYPKGYNLKSMINRYLISSLYPKADYITPNAKLIKYDLVKNFMIPKDKIEVIYNPFDLKQIDKIEKTNQLDQFQKPIIVNVGSLHERKNQELLILAFARSNIDGTLLIFGEGNEKNKLEDLIVRLELTKRVYLMGHKKDIFSYLKSADLFVLSSKREGFPNVIVEAMACGLPIVSTDCKSGPREILAPDSDEVYFLKDDIEYSKYGVLVPENNIELLAQGIKKICDNTLLDKYKSKSLERAKNFDKSIIIEQYVKLIYKTLGR